MMRILLLPLALLAALVVAASAGADTKTVQITRSGFTPSSTTINVGDTVTWKNADVDSHQVVANDGSFASPTLKSGESFSYTFPKAGKTTYHDSFATTHRGTVTVNAPAANVTLSANAETIVYGGDTSVSGVVTNQLTNEPVALTAQPFGKGTQAVATTTTQANGAFSFGVSPTIQTSYQAHWRTTNSPNVTVNVAPRVRSLVRRPLRPRAAPGRVWRVDEHQARLPRRQLPRRLRSEAHQGPVDASRRPAAVPGRRRLRARHEPHDHGRPLPLSDRCLCHEARESTTRAPRHICVQPRPS